MKRFLIPALWILAIILTACSSPSSSDQTPLSPAPASNIHTTPTDVPAILATMFPNMAGNSEMNRTDQQGAIIVDVIPLNLDMPADNLEFDVALNTHSVDLSMDLAPLSTLSTDTEISIHAILWDAPRGGHHVSGKLIFPTTKEGNSILIGATKLTLTIIDLDAPSRVFEWDLK